MNLYSVETRTKSVEYLIKSWLFIVKYPLAHVQVREKSLWYPGYLWPCYLDDQKITCKQKIAIRPCYLGDQKISCKQKIAIRAQLFESRLALTVG